VCGDALPRLISQIVQALGAFETKSAAEEWFTFTAGAGRAAPAPWSDAS
jgi:hypothetical protein